MKISETQMMLFSLLLDSAIRAIFDKISGMDDEQVLEAIQIEMDRKDELMNRLERH